MAGIVLPQVQPGLPGSTDFIARQLATGLHTTGTMNPVLPSLSGFNPGAATSLLGQVNFPGPVPGVASPLSRFGNIPNPSGLGLQGGVNGIRTAGGTTAPFNLSSIPNPSGLGQQGGVVSLAQQAEAAAPGGLRGLIAPLSKIPFPKSFAGKAGLGIGLPIAGNFLGDAAGGDDSFLGRLIKGAGTGAGLGAFLGPQAAVAGGVLGGAYNAIFGGEEKSGDSVWVKDETLTRAGYSDEDKTQIKLMYQILKDTQGEEQAKAAIGQIIIQDLQGRQAQQDFEEQSQKRMLASQALAAQFFQPFTQQMMDSAQQRYAITEKIADELPPAYRSVARAQNAAALDNSTRVATAYAAQAQLLPSLSAIEYQKSLADQLSQQQAATVIANLYGGGNSGGSNLADILAAQTGG